MNKFKLYYFSRKSLSFVEANWFKTKYGILTVLLGMSVLAVVFEVNQYLDDALGLGFHRNKVLVGENLLLKEQLRMISNRLQGLQKKLLALNEKGNELRLLVDLPKIDEDTREAGFGGTDERMEFGASQSVNDLLNDLRVSVSKAEKEMKLQQMSYKEAMDAHTENREKFAHLPAIKPMEGYYSLHGFGTRLHPIFKVRLPHEGIDIANEIGSPVYATGNGIVQSSGRVEAGYGNMIILDHGFGYTTLYGHLQKVLVKEGQQVKRGDLIGVCGSTGVSTNPHLHYEVRHKGVLQNPVDYFFDDIDYHKIRDQLALSEE